MGADCAGEVTPYPGHSAISGDCLYPGKSRANMCSHSIHRAGGRLATHQRTPDDPKGTWSLLA